MTILSLPEAESTRPFESLVDMRAANNSLVRKYGKTLDADPPLELLDEFDKFISRGRETGMLLDNPEERWEAQNMLNFWAKLLYRYCREPGDEPPIAALSEFGSPQPARAKAGPVVFQAPPEPPDVYVGREGFRSDVKQRLLAGKDVVLCSLPGTGTTLLAAKLAHDLGLREKYRDGVLWAKLGEEPDVATILRRWAKALQIPMVNPELLDDEHVAKLIRQTLGRCHMLLVIGDAWQSDVALALRLGGQNCAHIVTTYLMPVALDLDAQAAVTVPGFSRSDGLRLFTEQAPKAVESQEEDAQKLFEVLDNSPMALYLVASYYRRHSGDGSRPDLKGLHSRLLEEKRAIEAERSSVLTRPCNEVQTPASLLAAIGWCFEHLESEEQYVLQAFSAFPPRPNSFSEAAARFVTERRTRAIEVLLDYGLLERTSDRRYSLHRAVSDFLKRRSPALTDHTPEQRMAHFFVDLVKKQATSLSVLDLEQKNILAALEVAHKQGLWTHVAEGTKALFGYFDRQGLYDLAENTLTRAQEAAEKSKDLYNVAAIRLRIGEIKERRSKYEDANTNLQASLEIAKQLKDDDLCARALQNLGVVAMAVAQYQDAERYLKEALSLAHNTEIECAIETRLAWMERGLGRFPESRKRTERALKLAQRQHYFRQEIELKLSLGVLDFFEGNYKQAKERDEEALEAAERAKDKRLQCALYQALGGVEIELENFDMAESHLMKGLHLSIEIGHRWYSGVIWKELGELRIKQGLPNAASAAFNKSVELARDVNSPELTGLAFYGLARVAALQNNKVEARLQGRTSLNIFKSIGHYKEAEVMAWISSINGNTPE